MRYEARLMEMLRGLGFDKINRRKPFWETMSPSSKEDERLAEKYRKRRKIKNRIARESRRRNRK